MRASEEDYTTVYSGDEDAGIYSASDDDLDLPEDDKVNGSGEINYTFLKEEEIAKLQKDYITEVSTVLSISKSDACLLLLYFNWRDEELKDEWFADEEKVRENAGLLEKPMVKHSASANQPITCRICFDEYYYSSESTISSILSTSCGHPYCRDCWEGYISTSICDSGPACLMLRCPEPSCKAAVGPELIENVLVVTGKKAEYDKYKHYLLRSYVEHNRKKIRWCPAPDCKYAIKFDAPDRMSSYDVSCLCSHSYCWNCEEENHRPVFCETVKKWILKNADDSQNGQWIMVNTKPCPKCNRSIEKNQGCNHMTCTAPCRFQFCWYCLGPYGTCHCNAFNRRATDMSGGVWGMAEKERMQAKIDLERYAHYYERWANNGSSKERALKDFDKVKTVHIKELGHIQKNTIEHKYDFIIEAWQQIIECRQVLRWTYAYGYYMKENEDAKRHLFEHLQGHAEFSLERLHKCAESELQQFLNLAHDDKVWFIEFQKKLISLTRVTGTYFDRLLTALEDGLSEILTKKQKKKVLRK
ncbi:probable E3 ubiquitin-protein ligase ARI8 [Rosa rugosa]|uniref:probable E3 ubiquitin-protein ligase ARI8 n=1 Tax=Rosa rugosa TaxID=74645 RepID=UPI002B40DBCB|nr:probable E3 ubiquitin-protein ligase ARI8 [Rosa rugosa]